MELTRTLNFVEKLMVRVGNYIYQLSSRRKKIYYKGAVDLVTQFDRLSQRMIIEVLKEKFPDYGILSEENYVQKSNNSARWILDPLDGTTNFAHNLPIWSISLALEMEDKILLGLVYDPTRKELFTAIKGRGAYLNGKRIRVSQTKSLGKSLLVTGFPYDIRKTKENNLNYFAKFCIYAQAVRRLGSAALDLCYTACGRFDGYWELKLSPWDQAAGYLILKEAGGKITDFKGKPFNIYDKEILGTNGFIHSQMLKILNKND
uniref:Inositol-1-monophosphatase n=1 Tax=candidate division WOR-3 bacterium TaxID=2052148 RepID=A0A7C4TH85_UNCW3